MATLPEEPRKLGEALGEGSTLAIVETIGQPHHAKVGLAAKLALQRLGERLAVRRVRVGNKSRGALARLLGGDRSDERIARG